ncbi:MAG: hypothetical protein LBG80_09730, partial [Bacteroidales bacterium]|nr:hypothetical protein [Bacteroidales bacterium]
NPVKKWDKKTFILYGEKDNMTEKCILNSFVERNNCILDILKDGEHFFHTSEQINYLNNWIKKVME